MMNFRPCGHDFLPLGLRRLPYSPYAPFGWLHTFCVLYIFVLVNGSRRMEKT